jgi:hypothetical protein
MFLSTSNSMSMFIPPKLTGIITLPIIFIVSPAIPCMAGVGLGFNGYLCDKFDLIYISSRRTLISEPESSSALEVVLPILTTIVWSSV